ncbi:MULTISPECIES: L,D-transpeptidase family protein [Sporomusa]|uniref:L,D-transpeptidase YkuD n=1 Tax=Sporomusa sphaeroides DSM 2875 TaxID=1337886 RepID=A0ABM9VXB3_9FIRM|nr:MULTISPECIES: L,D-transpeptidase family protein [Sporomusa]MCM0759973.1 L,D-transpeptidase family protein [Sporomusa sphaeroides DSM 2875]OLS58403.1 putative L,D-transpeptidase YkuD [Sporomusa sphaeroides DSM 2875]CVK17410.1 Putative L,D-transpeptidase YkuD [Sporomusa sphaeroides DSM 2875]
MNSLWSFKVRRSRIFFGIAVLAILSIVFSILGFEYMDEQDLAAIDSRQPFEAPAGKVSILIKVQSRELELHNDGELYKKYRIAVGKSKTPTPIGEWNVVWKDYDWGTGFGTRWMGLNVPWGTFGIHGTNKPWSIGQFASHGCIRMRNKDVEELFEWTPIGTPVSITGRNIRIERNLKYKASGSDVAALQLKLKEMGYFQGRADGLFGTMTEEAVKAYQADKGVAVTGVASKELCTALGI